MSVWARRAPLAIQQARRRFGNLALWQDRGYDVRGAGVMEPSCGPEVRHSPSFEATRILAGGHVTLALGIGIGIGMTTTIASVIDAAMLTKDVPSLRLITDDLWNQVKERQQRARRTLAKSGNVSQLRRPRHICSRA